VTGDVARCGNEKGNKSQRAGGVLRDGAVLARRLVSGCRFLELESNCDMAEFLIEWARPWQSRI
jgi:hypothetical protein